MKSMKTELSNSPNHSSTNPPIQPSNHPALHSSNLPSPQSADGEPWPDPVQGSALLDELAQLLRRFVVLPKWAAETLALWTLHTYAFELRDVSAYLGIESPEKRCGKTTLLAVLSKLVSRPVAAANISPPAFFRVIQENRPTLLIDEADTFLQGNDELRGILNAGYTRDTAFVMRVAPPDPRHPAPATRPSSGDTRHSPPATRHQPSPPSPAGVPKSWPPSAACRTP